MFLTKLEPPASFKAPKDVEIEHKLIMSLFPPVEEENARQNLAVLYRAEKTRNMAPYYLIQSKIEPCLVNIKNPILKEKLLLKTKDSFPIYENIVNNTAQICSYKIRVNPVKVSNGKRKALTSTQTVFNWWQTKQDKIGLEILPDQTEIIIENKLHLKNNALSTATIIGKTKILNREALFDVLNFGFGKEKSYGYGLMLLAK